jgi:hypothetical protein
MGDNKAKTDVKYRMLFIRKEEEKPFFSCICYSKISGTDAENNIKDLFKIKDNVIVRAELAE